MSEPINHVAASLGKYVLWILNPSEPSSISKRRRMISKALQAKYVLATSAVLSFALLAMLGTVIVQVNVQHTSKFTPITPLLPPKIVLKPAPKPVGPPSPPAQSEPAPTKPSPTPAAPQNLPEVAGKNTSYDIGVLVLKYFPLTANGQNININITGDVGDPYSVISQRTTDETNELLADIPKATQYLGYKYPGDAPSLRYHIVADKAYTTAVPIKAHGDRITYPDYNGMMKQQNICDYVDNQGVREVWLWAYQGPTKASTGQPYLGIDETKMSGPFGDISNSYEYNDMPICKHTYTLYTFNYGRATAEAIHSWGHQIENEMRAVDPTLFGLFQGPWHPQTTNEVGRCGSVHNPPNAREDYDYSNTTPQQSDCEDWTPDGLGALTTISCSAWNCSGDFDSDQLNYQIWMWQHLPGMNNVKTYHGQQLRNWWDVHGEFDTVMGSSKHLTL